MLRNQPRWHDAANGPLLGEARLLWRAKRTPPPATAPDPEEEGEGEQAEQAASANETSEGAQSPEGNGNRTPIDYLAELTRRSAEHVMKGKNSDEQIIPNSNDLIARTESLQQDLESHIQSVATLREAIEEKKRSGVDVPEEILKSVTENERYVQILTRYIVDLKAALDLFQLSKWEQREITPATFVVNYGNYIDKMKTIDEANAKLSLEDGKKRHAARLLFLDQTKSKVRMLRSQLPAPMPMEQTKSATGISDEEIWALYTNAEKDGIIAEISKAAGITSLKSRIHDDISTVEETICKKDVQEKLMALQRTITEAGRKEKKSNADDHDDASEGGNRGILETIKTTLANVNNAAGLEWMTIYEWIDAFKEVKESVLELRKRKSRLKVSSAVTSIGRVASLIPGFGGEELENVLDEQQEGKNDEEKDKFKKELGNSKKDFGFKELFSHAGHEGLLTYYHRKGDTNRTRAILEFAAGKGLLYGMEGKSWNDYILPGNIPFASLMPKSWSEAQIDTWMGNLNYSNTQGINAQTKAGEDFCRGRSSLDDYIVPFENTVNSMSLWFAKGIANVALTKVKEGEMSALMTLIVCEAWENNSLFRRYVPMEWLDRLPGDSKQLMIGMIKYDKQHLLDGARSEKHPDERTHDLARAHADGKDGNQRLGPLVEAVRTHILKKGKFPSPDSMNDEEKKKFRRIQAKVLACKSVGPKDGLPEGVHISLFNPELQPYMIKYDPNEMRDAAVDKLGDDFFIERSEIINCTAEVMQYIGNINQDGFTAPTKARYFFSQIIDAYDELEDLATTPGPEQNEYKRSLNIFRAKQRKNLDFWIERSLQKSGSKALLTEQHSDQQGRRIVVTMLAKGLISMSVIQKLATGSPPNQAARSLLAEFNALNNQHTETESPGGIDALNTAA